MRKDRLLLIDDDESLRNVLEYSLREVGYEVVPAKSGAEGLSCFEQSGFAVIVTDVRLPDMDGHRVLREVRARSPRTKVIVITAHGSAEQAHQAITLGAFVYMRKPFSLERLRHIVAAAFNMVAREEKAMGISSSFDGELAYCSPGEHIPGPKPLLTGSAGTRLPRSKRSREA